MHTGYRLNNSYVFEKVIGIGGMGEVWSARRSMLGDLVAIKVLKLNSFPNKETIRRQLKKEAVITSALSHPNICKVFEFIEQDDVCFLVMELLEGIDLQTLLKNPNLFRGIDRSVLALYVCKEVLRALDTAHNINHPEISKILHRDIKPANVFLTNHGEVKLLDLGVAKTETEVDNSKTANAFFSLHYTSPDLWEHGTYNVNKYSAQNDIYSLGLVFYEIITGKKAFPGIGKELYEKLESGSIPSIKDCCESREIEGLFIKWTSKRPSERFSTVASLLSLISNLLLDYQVNESIILDAIKKFENHSLNNNDHTEKNIEIMERGIMKLKKTGNLQESSGKEAEEDVLAIIAEIFGKDYARIFVNNTIPQRNKTPDFVIPVFDQKGVFKLIIVECKASTTIYPDGTTKYSDPYAQILAYRERISLSLKVMNRECEILCYVVFPNRNDIPKNLKEGRDGVIWMTLPSFKECLKGYKSVYAHDKAFELVQMIYSKNEVLQKYREKLYFSKEQEKILHWKFGGTKRITGLAGTGKSLVLAKKLIKDIKESDKNNFLYLTHNTNLLLKFQEYIKSFLEEDCVALTSTAQVRSSTIFTCEVEGRKVFITFCTFDAFSTSCITESMDKILYQKDSYGHLYNLSREIRGGKPAEKEFKKEREELLAILLPLKKGREDIFEKYSALYIDEFQDCRIDPSRFKFPALFVNLSENGEPNLCFTEDSLQSFVRYKILQEIDESFDDIKKNALATNLTLGLPSLQGKSRNLDTIYRTPEKIFRLTLNILENQGGLLKNKKDDIMSLKFKNHHGDYFIIEESEVVDSVAFMLNERQRFEHEIMFIESFKHRNLSDLFNKINDQFTCNDVNNKNPPHREAINFFHEFNVRGLESKVVYLIVDESLIENPNYVYTLVCRTKVDIVLVRSSSLANEKFESFINFLVDSKLKIAS